MVIGIVKEKNILSVLVLIGAFVATYFFKVNIMIIILICGLIGAFTTYYRGKTRKERL